MSEGKSFHIHAAATGRKARRPTVENLTAGTNWRFTGLRMQNNVNLCN